MPVTIPFAQLEMVEVLVLTRNFLLDSEVKKLVRAPDNNLILSESMVSAIMLSSPGRIMHTITDLGSTDGTRVNNVELKSHTPSRLANGDVIRCGTSELI